MLKRMEIYVDSALLSFPLTLIVFAGSIMLPFARPFLRSMAPELAGMLALVGPAVLIGGALAVWLSRVLHRKTASEPMTHDESRGSVWAAGGSGLIAALLGIELWRVGSNWPVVWMGLAVLLIALAVALLYDSMIDLFRVHTHRVLDVLRVLFLLPLGASLVIALTQPAQPGSDADVGPWVIGVTAYMLLVALVAFGWDEFAAWRARNKGSHGRLAASA